jgi:hypothetical protein
MRNISDLIKAAYLLDVPSADQVRSFVSQMVWKLAAASIAS